MRCKGSKCPAETLSWLKFILKCLWLMANGLLTYSECAEETSWERLRRVGGGCVLPWREEGYKGEAWHGNNSKLTASPTSFQTCSPALTHSNMLYRVFLGVLEFPFHVPFSYSCDGFPWTLEINDTFTNSWQPWCEFPFSHVLLPSWTLHLFSSSLLSVNPCNTITRKWFWAAKSMPDTEFPEHNINIICKDKMHHLQIQDKY